VERRRFSLEPLRPYSLGLTAARFAQFPEVVNRFEGGVYRRLILAAGKPLPAIVPPAPPQPERLEPNKSPAIASPKEDPLEGAGGEPSPALA